MSGGGEREKERDRRDGESKGMNGVIVWSVCVLNEGGVFCVSQNKL